MNTSTLIKLRYRACDGTFILKRFRSFAGAQRWARSMVGDHPDMGLSQAVSQDGIGTIHVVSGTTIGALFIPDEAAPTPAPSDDGYDPYYNDSRPTYDGYHSPGEYGSEEHQAYGDAWLYRDCPGAW